MTAYFAVFIFCRGFRYIFLFFHIGFIEVDTMKKMILCCMVAVLSMTMLTSIHADEKTKQTTKNDPQIAQNAKSAYLMEYTSGKVIYAKNEKAKLYPASMTKMMGLLLIFESLHDGKLDWKDEVTTSAYAASMGGSQVFLEENETMSVKDMIKSICIASANDAMVAMAEKVGGSAEHFVEMMDEKAKKLNLCNTHFMNPTGLHDPQHYTCAKDMAIVGKALIKEGGDDLLKITSTYDAYIREDSEKAFWLVNTNKLLKQYPGVDGLKSGFTSQAMSCITITAKKKDLRLIAVVMGEPSSKVRNGEIKQMLDYGFSQYQQGLLYAAGTKMKTIPIENGKPQKVDVLTDKDLVYVFEKGSEPKETAKEISLRKTHAPFKKGEIIGKVQIKMSDGYTMETALKAAHDVAALDYTDLFMKALKDVFA